MMAAQRPLVAGGVRAVVVVPGPTMGPKAAGAAEQKYLLRC